MFLQHLGSDDRTKVDRRIDACIAMSPQPGAWLSPDEAFQSVTVPTLCMTGTEDTSPINSTLTAADRRKVFASLPAGGKYELVLDGGTHMTFVDRPRLRNVDSNHHSLIQKITTQFWKAYLLNDEAAKQWLQSDLKQQGLPLNPADLWQWK